MLSYTFIDINLETIKTSICNTKDIIDIFFVILQFVVTSSFPSASETTEQKIWDRQTFPYTCFSNVNVLVQVSFSFTKNFILSFYFLRFALPIRVKKYSYFDPHKFTLIIIIKYYNVWSIIQRFSSNTYKQDI